MARAAAFLRGIGLALGLLAVAASADSGVSEEQLKAAFVFNFAKYVEWPSELSASGAPVVACAVGGDSLAQALQPFDGRAVSGRNFNVRRVLAADDYASCNIAILTDIGPHRMEEVLRRLPSEGVLTISDIEGFIEAGGMIGMVRVGDRLQFDINHAALQRANLRASSQLLKLARKLSGRGR